MEVYSGKSIGQELKSVTWTWKPLWVRKRNTSGDVGIYIYTHIISYDIVYIYIPYISYYIIYIYRIYIYQYHIYIMFLWVSMTCNKNRYPKKIVAANVRASAPHVQLAGIRTSGSCRNMPESSGDWQCAKWKMVIYSYQKWDLIVIQWDMNGIYPLVN